MELIGKIAGTALMASGGDIPYWMTHFEGWEKSWASFDDATVEAFRAKTGSMRARISDRRLHGCGVPALGGLPDRESDGVRQGDRLEREAVNPRCLTIPEIYPGIEEPATVVGAMCTSCTRKWMRCSRVPGGTDAFAATKTPLEWFRT